MCSFIYVTLEILQGKYKYLDPDPATAIKEKFFLTFLPKLKVSDWPGKSYMEEQGSTVEWLDLMFRGME